MFDLVGSYARFVMGPEDRNRSLHGPARLLHPHHNPSSVVLGFQGSARHVPFGYSFEEGRKGGIRNGEDIMIIESKQ